MSQQELLNDNLSQIWDFLSKSGVPVSSINKLKEETANGEVVQSLCQAQQYMHCYPHMDGAALIHHLYQSWKALCDYRYNEQIMSKKAWEDLKMNPKAKGEIVGEAKLKYEGASKLALEVNLELYRIRTLKGLYI
uniref:Uncharacterized protein n=1 Tax=Leptocylindrus danicus TaxID=163516 RepID=A0A7S2PJS5_9STRA|mmetsp:Transcript_34426/g.49985  ORF Transcript_34426/g.49985 Transcript_34426/m.49985 type:complete len:135 (+) Transcript_34426:120-524(+)